MKNMTLQWKITILSVIVLTVCTVALTALSIHNVEQTVFTSSHVQNFNPGTPYDVVVTLREFNATSIIFCILANLLGGTVVYLLMGKAVRSLQELTTAIERIDEQQLSEHILEIGGNDEIGRLTHSFNGMMSRLEDAFQRQSNFTANAAHELKTPLTIMKTGVQVLLADQSAVLSDYVDSSRETLESIDRLTKIVDNLLLLASIGEPSHDSDEEVFIEPLMEAIQGDLSDQLEGRNMKCLVYCQELSVIGNPALLYRVFSNLIENACKYGVQGGTIEVIATQRGTGIEVCVKDDGPGILPEHLPYIFDAFYRVDKSRSREIGGSGLGLSIVKTMVESVGGTVLAESAETHGASFRVWLPAS